MMKSKIALSAVLMIIATLFASACDNAISSTPEHTTTTPTVIVDSTIIAEGRVEPMRYARIAFTISGTVNEVLVKEGQAVRKGDLLVRLGDESDADYAAAQFELVSAQKALNDLQNTAGTDLAQAVIDLQDAKDEYDDALDHLDYVKNDKKIPQTQILRVLTSKGYTSELKIKSFKGPAPEDWVIEAENDVTLKKAKMDAAQLTYDRLKGGVDADQLAVLEARLNAAKARLSDFEVIAPFDGTVAEMSAKLGSSINAGEPAVTVADFSYWVVKTTDLTEIDVVKLEGDQPVIVTLDAIPDVELAGTIDSIGQTFSENQGDVVYEVIIMLTDIDPAIRWGMTAEVKFKALK
jgi:multidrug resistance efflux pump